MISLYSSDKTLIKQTELANVSTDCHNLVDPSHYFVECLYSMCSCENTFTIESLQANIAPCLCPVFAKYATACANKGVNLNWRENVMECGNFLHRKLLQ